ncbi:MAG TPA: polysaccharide biosynthesis tyrosine autokinase [Thermodesulfovibrionales bacterium]|nr:polysaccharide biosynthesis tyrosine autokinase [Thermodesulfovibrionales bacterium]
MNNSTDTSRTNTSLQKTDEYPVSLPENYVYQQERETHLRDYLRVILRRKWIVMTFFLIAITTALLGMFLMKPIYRSSVVLKIDKEPNVVNLKDVYEKDGGDEYYQTQYKVLKSRGLAKRVIRSMKLDQNPDFAGSIAPPKSPAEMAETPAAQNTEEDSDPTLVDRFLKSLSVEPQPRSRLVKISFDSPSPALTASVSNEVAKVFINYGVESKFDATLQARDWLEKQLEDLKIKVERAEDALNKYVTQSGIVFMSDGGGDSKEKGQNMVTKRLEDLSTQLVQATSDRVTKEVMFLESQRLNGEAIPAVQNNPLIQGLQKDYAAIESEYAQLSKVYKPDYPKMVRLKEQSNQLKKQIDAETRKALEGLRVDYQAASRKERYLSSALDKHRSEVTGQNEKMVQYSILKREADTNRELYNNLLHRLKEVGVTASLTASNIHILDRAEVPRAPYKPNKKRNLVIAVMVGLLGGIGLAFFVEYLDNTVKTSDDIEKEVALPSLGLVPDLLEKGRKNAFPVVTYEDKSSPLSEAYRSIGTYIQFSSAGRPPKSILVTSARQGEGKTTTVVNIAVTLTHNYGRGIIIDSDMRRPMIHKIFDVDNSRGLSSFLAGHLELNDGLIQKTKVENLEVIPAGVLPPNPSELLNSYRFKDLLTELFNAYSFILIDSPPVLGLSDSLVLSTLMDGVVMVTRAGNTPKDAAVQARKLLQGVNAKILGVILNGMTEADLKYGSYSYYYTHYYKDGYDDHKGKKKRRKTGNA